MKRNILTVVALGASLFSAAYVLGQTNKDAKAPAEAPKETKLVKMATLPTAQANREFQHNVQVLQAQRQAVLEVNAAMEKEKDAKKKAELKKEVDKRLAELNENNAKMQKAYGFSLARNYTLEIETSHIYVHVTEEEAAKIAAEEAKAAKGKAAPKK